LYRFFIEPRYSIDYRRGLKFRWQSEAAASYRVLLLLNGDANLSIDGQPVQIGSTDVVLLEPSVSANGSGDRFETITINISAQMLIDCALRMRLVTSETTVMFPQRVLRNETKLAELARMFAAELVSADVGREIVIAALIEQLLVQLLRRHSTMRRSSELELSRVGLIDRRIRRAAELMHARLDEELTLKDIAAASYLSPFHFSRLFKKLTGVTPLAYLAAQRITRAQMLLAQSDLPITQIAAQVGYGSASHFTKAFRQSTGLSPREFRASVISRS
jgi:AraC family transcriptional regulator